MQESTGGTRVISAARPSAPAVLRTAVRTLMVGLTLLYMSGFAYHPGEFTPIVDGIFDNAVSGFAAAVCLGRAVLVRERRWPFALFGLAVLALTFGDLINVFVHLTSSAVSYPSLADVGYLSAYPLLIVATLLLARPEMVGVSPGTLLDGLVGGLCCAAAGSVLIVQPEVGQLGGSLFARVVGAAYPVLDLSLLAVIVAVTTARGGRPTPTWVWLTAGMTAQALADTLYLQRLSAGTYEVGTIMDGFWGASLAMIALAATCTDRSRPRGPERIARRLILPNVFSVLAVAALVYGSVSAHKLPLYAVILFCAALGTAVKRTAIGFSALRLLATSQHQAQTDELTQLSNRRHFDQQAQRILVHRGPEDSLSLVMVDLDGFKTVNDTFGHAVGDEMLRQVASRLRRVVRANDLLARLGGDEFGLLLVNCDRATATMIGERLVAEVTQPMVIEGTVHTPGASVGITLCPDDGDDLHALMRQADAAMFDAKAHHGGAILFDLTRHSEDDRGLNVQQALSRHELVVHYQPQFDLRDGRMVGVEALVRWDHPTRGLLMPDTFLPFFERTGLMAQLTLEVVRIAVRDREAWQRAGRDLALSVNVAPSALLGGDLAEPVLAILSAHHMPAGLLTLEITENAVIFDLQRSREALEGLRSLGIRLSLDDYGTGYCSLTYLRNLSLDEVKIDRSFVMELRPDSTDAAIVTSTLWLGRKLGLRTVAEGVETEAALRLLQEMGCELAQGYLLARPMTADQVLVLSPLDWVALTGRSVAGQLSPA